MLARLLVLTVLAVTVHGHSYHLGECPSVEPLHDLDMSKFLGKWYVIQKSSKSIRCLVYNFSSSPEPNKFILEQTSEHSTMKMLGFGNKYRFSGDLTVPNPDIPAKMHVKLPLGTGSASYTVVDTDYDTYGAVFACQNILGLGNRQAATVLSRHPTLDQVHLNKIRSKLTSFGIDISELSVIDQYNCHENENPKLEIKVENENLVGSIHSEGEKHRNTHAVVTEEPKIFNSDETSGIDFRFSTPSNKEEVSDGQKSNEVEWLP